MLQSAGRKVNLLDLIIKSVRETIRVTADPSLVPGPNCTPLHLETAASLRYEVASLANIWQRIVTWGLRPCTLPSVTRHNPSLDEAPVSTPLATALL